MKINHHIASAFTKNNLSLGAISTFSSLFSIVTAYLLFNHNIISWVWSCIFGLFLCFHRFGDSKKKQVMHIIQSSLCIFSVIILTSLINLLRFPYTPLLLTLVIFGSLCLSRYIKESRILGVFMVTYLLIYIQFQPATTFNALPNILYTITVCLLIATTYTCILTCLFSISISDQPRLDKTKYLIKRAVRTTILLCITLIIAHIFNNRHVAWIGISILVINQDDLRKSYKRCLERAAGTLTGALIGLLLVHFYFAYHPIGMVITCFFLIFLNYTIIRYQYSIGICLGTIWITSAYYYLQLSMDIDHLMLGRITDTLIGITLGLLGEYFLFRTKTTRN